MYKNLIKIFKILNPDQLKKFKILLFFMMISMIFETIGISSMVPLINFFTDGSLLPNLNIDLNNFFYEIGVKRENILHIVLIIIFIIYFIKNLYLGFYSWVETKFSYKVRFDIGVSLFKKYLNKPYMFHVQNNSSHLMAKIIQDTAVFGSALSNASALLTEILVITGITLFLFIVKPLETSIIFLIGSILSTGFYMFVKNKVVLLGEQRTQAEKAKMKSLQQGLGAIKDIIIYKVQKLFTDSFSVDSNNIANVGFKISFINKLPRIWFELCIISIVTIVIFIMSLQKIDSNSIMATIGIFLIASLRIIPSINKILVALQTIKFSEPALNSLQKDLKIETFDILNEEKKEKGTMDFKNEIKIENLNFRYPNSQKDVLKNLNFSIKKNQFIGIVGETGSGKSTLVDLLTGLIKPSSGSIKVDGMNISKNLDLWKKKIGYVPQNLYLMDDTVKKNIAFGYKDNEISFEIIQNCINQSELSKFISGLENGIESKVGEKAVKISGGEKQRVGIARALYHDPQVLIFDEATSSLDLTTEKKIFETLKKFKLNKTIIFITHKNTNLNICDKVFKIINNTIDEVKINNHEK